MKDRLYLLRPGFMNAGLGPLYCGDSVAVEGLLSFCPRLREEVDVQYLDFARPRAVLVEALGPVEPPVPVIVLSDERVIRDGGVASRTANGRRYIAEERIIRRYLSSQYDAPLAG